ncbi:MAG TPA: hypothetical protein GXX36_14795 [Clostridiaceae bacterium]|nr:hypothetical protein [Clostridiaceae bacterium]
MIKKREFLELASRLSEQGDDRVISKVQQIVQKTASKNLPEQESKNEFLTMIRLYYNQTGILGTGKKGEREFKSFIENGLKIRFANNGQVLWQSNELSSLSMDELNYVLGWARRIAKREELVSRDEKGLYDKNPFRGSITKEGKKEEIDISGLSLEEQIKAMKNSFNRRRI